MAACIAHSACANPVVWLHGWNSDGSLWDDLQSRMVKSAGASSADFLTLSYYGGELGFSTDTPIEEVAAAVARRIQDFHDSCGERVDVVCHSMGGLVFRSLIAQECLADPSIVRRYHRNSSGARSRPTPESLDSMANGTVILPCHDVGRTNVFEIAVTA